MPSARFSTFLVCALSLSIGWGIRGNFGHEYGAMIPGGLAAIAVCLLSGREDWRRRVAYFAFFGAIGWGFGGSMSYGQVLAYAYNGDSVTQPYGFAALFYIGFLWAAIGGAGTALPAVADREHLTQLFRPIIWVFAAWCLWDIGGPVLAEAITENLDTGDFRHRSPFYWFDADWTLACVTLVALGLFDLWDRREGNVVFLPVYALAGAAAGFVAKVLCDISRLSSVIGSVFVRPLGDLELFRRAQELGMDDPFFTDKQRALLEKYGGDLQAFQADLYTNWPVFFEYGGFSPHLGWVLGLVVGLTLYFYRYGKFRSGARLPLYMGIGFLLCFLVFPVLLGLRMTPPRSDSWAGTTGVFLGVMAYLFRTGLFTTAYAAVVSGIVGGIGFSLTAFLKMVMIRPGNPRVVEDADLIARWAHWQSANWHSWLEQTYGFVNGLGIALAMALIASRVPLVSDDPPVRRWTKPFAVAFFLLWIVFVNWYKAVETWVKQDAVPAVMKMPLFESVELFAETWFILVFWTVGAGFIVLLARHMKKPIALVPATHLGQGMLLFVVFLWIAVIFNHERAITGFSQGRLITEAVIFVNASIVTVLLLTFARDPESDRIIPVHSKTPQWGRAALVGLFVFFATVFVESWGSRMLYDHDAGKIAGHGGEHLRFGPDAEWRINPLTKTKKHN